MYFSIGCVPVCITNLQSTSGRSPIPVLSQSPQFSRTSNSSGQPHPGGSVAIDSCGPRITRGFLSKTSSRLYIHRTVITTVLPFLNKFFSLVLSKAWWNRRPDIHIVVAMFEPFTIWEFLTILTTASLGNVNLRRLYLAIDITSIQFMTYPVESNDFLIILDSRNCQYQSLEGNVHHISVRCLDLSREAVYKGPDAGPGEEVGLCEERDLTPHFFMHKENVRIRPERRDAVVQILVVKEIFIPLLHGTVALIDQGISDELTPTVSLGCQLLHDSVPGP